MPTGGLQPISRDTDNNGQMDKLLVDEQKELMRNLLFLFTKTRTIDVWGREITNLTGLDW